uniref:Uncharacterized protein n=1 Tax=Cacopsylla melanoneura TaxID=428564 RepID=A0A8D8X4P8_9HEMI
MGKNKLFPTMLPPDSLTRFPSSELPVMRILFLGFGLLDKEKESISFLLTWFVIVNQCRYNSDSQCFADFRQYPVRYPNKTISDTVHTVANFECNHFTVRNSNRSFLNLKL